MLRQAQEEMAKREGEVVVNEEDARLLPEKFCREKLIVGIGREGHDVVVPHRASEGVLVRGLFFLACLHQRLAGIIILTRISKVTICDLRTRTRAGVLRSSRGGSATCASGGAYGLFSPEATVVKETRRKPQNLEPEA